VVVLSDIPWNFRTVAMFVIVLQTVFRLLYRYEHDLSAYQVSLAKTQRFCSCLHIFAMLFFILQRNYQTKLISLPIV
jgi:hypothetical protein